MNASDPPSTYSGSTEISSSASDARETPGNVEKRRFPRIQCRLPVEVSTEGAVPVRLPGTVTDISPCGCFVEMLSPLPVGTRVELLFPGRQSSFRCPGDVRNAQHGMGMGVAFIGLSDEDRRKVVALVGAEAAAGTSGPPELTSAAKATPAEPATAEKSAAPPSTAEAVEALIGLLMRKGQINRTELLEEIERLRAARRSR